MFKVANITSFALKPVATPGNSRMYGTEFDGDLGYTSDRHLPRHLVRRAVPVRRDGAPEPDATHGGPGYSWGTDPNTQIPNTGDAGTAHTIQSRLVLMF